MEETISLKELIQTIWKRIYLILGITITSVLIVGLYSYYFITPVYQADAKLFVTQSTDGDASLPEIQADRALASTYSHIIESTAILKLVIQELKLDMSVAELKNKITVQNPKDQQSVEIIVQDYDAEQAAEIANKVAKVFERENIMKLDNIEILDPATVPSSPIKPNPPLNIAIALVVGLMAGVGISFLLEYLDDSVKTAKDIEAHLDMPVLGVVSTMEPPKGSAPKKLGKGVSKGV